MRIQIKRKWGAMVSPQNIFKIFNEILKGEDELDQGKEHIWAIGLNGANRIQYIDLVHLGALTSCVASPREIFRRAVVKGSAKIMLVHNHPSGEAKASVDDYKLTETIAKAGYVLCIKLLDHVIVSKNGYYSFMESSSLLD